MSQVPTTLHTLLDVAHELVGQPEFDAEVALKVLVRMPVAELDLQTCRAIQDATMVAMAASDGGHSHATVARFALAKVIVLLEQKPQVAAVGNRTGTA